MKLARGEKVDTTETIDNGSKKVPSILLEPVSVDRSNLVSTVVKDGYQTLEKICEGFRPINVQSNNVIFVHLARAAGSSPAAKLRVLVIMTETNQAAPYLEMREITKSFPGVKALDGVTFDLHHGESMRWLGRTVRANPP